MTRKQKIEYLVALSKGLKPVDPTERPLLVNVKDGVCKVNATGEIFPESELDDWMYKNRHRFSIFIYRVPKGSDGDGLYI